MAKSKGSKKSTSKMTAGAGSGVGRMQKAAITRAKKSSKRSGY